MVLGLCLWNMLSNNIQPTLAGFAQWLGRRPEHPRLKGLIPDQWHLAQLQARSLAW